jgi:hypothetical protein
MVGGLRSAVGGLALCALLASGSARAATTLSTKPVITENGASCDIGPYAAATLLLPYFEVDVNAPATSALDTIFTVVNTSKLPQIARMTIWTDLGYPAAWCPIFLTGYGTYSVSMYNVIARGNFPYSSSRFNHGALSSDNKSNPRAAAEGPDHWAARQQLPGRQSARQRHRLRDHRRGEQLRRGLAARRGVLA